MTNTKNASQDSTDYQKMCLMTNTATIGCHTTTSKDNTDYQKIVQIIEKCMTNTATILLQILQKMCLT